MTVTRDVVIQLKVAADAKNASVSKAVAGELDKAHKSAADSHTRMTREVEGNLDRTTKAHKESLSRITALEKKHTEEIKNLRGEIAAQSERLQKQEVALAKKSATEKAAAEERAQQEYQGLVDKRMAAEKTLGESTKSALGGAVQLAGGLAQVGLIGEQNLEKFARQFVLIQGGINALSGGITTFFALRDAATAYRTATLSAATANQVLAASQVNNGAVGAATGAVSAGSTAAAGAGGAVAGKGLVALAGTAAKIGAVALAGAEALQFLRRSMGDSSDSAESFAGALLSWRKAAKEAAASTERLEAAEQKRAKMLAERDSANRSIQERASFNTQVRTSRSALAGRIDAASGGSERELAERERLRALSEIDQAQAEIAAAEERRIQRQKAGQFALTADAIQAAERLKAATESRAAAEEKLLGLAKRRLEAQKGLVEQTKSELEAALQAVSSANQQVDSALGRFSKLGRGDQNKLKEISERVKQGGDITGADADILERTGFGGDLVNKFRREEGIREGGQDVLGGLGELDAQAAAIQERNRLQTELQRQQQREIKVSDEVNEARRRYLKSLNRLSEANERELSQRANAQNIAVPGGGQSAVQSEIGNVGETVVNSMRQVDQQIKRDHATRAAMGRTV